MLSALAEMAATGVATGIPVPAVTIGNYAYKAYKNNKKIQKVQEYANPKSLLSDIGKQP
jgi:uncharacterized membrane protein YebE (DUF533 family)